MAVTQFTFKFRMSSPKTATLSKSVAWQDDQHFALYTIFAAKCKYFSSCKTKSKHNLLFCAGLSIDRVRSSQQSFPTYLDSFTIILQHFYILNIGNLRSRLVEDSRSVEESRLVEGGSLVKF